ncbi:MAG: transglutaminase-like domain-containing protein [Parcubacteria group bacterium]|jgi:hypothetical protein
MVTLLGVLAGLGFGSFCLHALIKLFGEKNNVILKNIITPALCGIEKSISQKTGDAIGQIQSQAQSYLQSVPADMRGDVEKMMDKGFASLYELFPQDRLEDIGIHDEAIITITNDRMQPFQLSGSMVKECQKIVTGKTGDMEKARAIFDWFETNISYDHARAARTGSGYRNARQVFDDRKGICGEMTFLYVVMAWYSGILSACYVHVEKDYRGEQVCHACAGFNHHGRIALVDPAYGMFDVQHQECKVKDNQETIDTFKSWN